MSPRRLSMHIVRSTFLLCLLAAALPATRADAMPILDQSFDPTGNITHGSGVGPGFDKAQTFTAGIAGQLTRVDVFIDSTGVNGTMDLEVRFTTGPGGGPATGMGASLALLTVPLPAIPTTPVRGFIVFDVSAFNVQVLQGQSYAIVLTAATGVQGTGIGWYGQAPGPYAGGTQWIRTASTGGAWALSPNSSDLGFRTYVLAVPEPRAGMLFLLGLVGFAVSRKARPA